ncbi:MAG: TIM barrel protein, partial [Candidatus Omnitrophica bacterium]|nr:TIM barrel protein [Candidatus Omnitrophota bacterium]
SGRIFAIPADIVRNRNAIVPFLKKSANALREIFNKKEAYTQDAVSWINRLRGSTKEETREAIRSFIQEKIIDQLQYVLVVFMLFVTADFVITMALSFASGIYSIAIGIVRPEILADTGFAARYFESINLVLVSSGAFAGIIKWHLNDRYGERLINAPPPFIILGLVLEIIGRFMLGSAGGILVLIGLGMIGITPVVWYYRKQVRRQSEEISVSKNDGGNRALSSLFVALRENQNSGDNLNSKELRAKTHELTMEYYKDGGEVLRIGPSYWKAENAEGILSFLLSVDEKRPMLNAIEIALDKFSPCSVDENISAGLRDIAEQKDIRITIHAEHVDIMEGGKSIERIEDSIRFASFVHAYAVTMHLTEAGRGFAEKAAELVGFAARNNVILDIENVRWLHRGDTAVWHSADDINTTFGFLFDLVSPREKKFSGMTLDIGHTKASFHHGPVKFLSLLDSRIPIRVVHAHGSEFSANLKNETHMPVHEDHYMISQLNTMLPELVHGRKFRGPFILEYKSTPENLACIAVRDAEFIRKRACAFDPYDGGTCLNQVYYSPEHYRIIVSLFAGTNIVTIRREMNYSEAEFNKFLELLVKDGVLMRREENKIYQLTDSALMALRSLEFIQKGEESLKPVKEFSNTGKRPFFYTWDACRGKLLKFGNRIPQSIFNNFRELVFTNIVIAPNGAIWLGNKVIMTLEKYAGFEAAVYLSEKTIVVTIIQDPSKNPVVMNCGLPVIFAKTGGERVVIGLFSAVERILRQGKKISMKILAQELCIQRPVLAKYLIENPGIRTEIMELILPDEDITCAMREAQYYQIKAGRILRSKGFEFDEYDLYERIHRLLDSDPEFYQSYASVVATPIKRGGAKRAKAGGTKTERNKKNIRRPRVSVRSKRTLPFRGKGNVQSNKPYIPGNARFPEVRQPVIDSCFCIPAGLMNAVGRVIEHDPEGMLFRYSPAGEDKGESFDLYYRISGMVKKENFTSSDARVLYVKTISAFYLGGMKGLTHSDLAGYVLGPGSTLSRDVIRAVKDIGFALRDAKNHMPRGILVITEDGFMLKKKLQDEITKEYILDQSDGGINHSGEAKEFLPPDSLAFIRLSRIFTPVQMHYLRLIRRVVNCGGKNKVVLYIGSGADISTALFATGAKIFIFADKLSFKSRRANKDGINKRMEVYFSDKRSDGYSDWKILEEYLGGSEEPLFAELREMNAEIVNSAYKSDLGAYEISFLLPGENEPRMILYFEIEDARDISTYPESFLRFISEGIDICMIKAFRLITLPLQIQKCIIAALPVGGIVLTDELHARRLLCSGLIPCAGREMDEVRLWEEKYDLSLGYSKIMLLRKINGDTITDSLN